MKCSSSKLINFLIEETDSEIVITMEDAESCVNEWKIQLTDNKNDCIVDAFLYMAYQGLKLACKYERMGIRLHPELFTYGDFMHKRARLQRFAREHFTKETYNDSKTLTVYQNVSALNKIMKAYLDEDIDCDKLYKNCLSLVHSSDRKNPTPVYCNVFSDDNRSVAGLHLNMYLANAADYEQCAIIQDGKLDVKGKSFYLKPNYFYETALLEDDSEWKKLLDDKTDDENSLI